MNKEIVKLIAEKIMKRDYERWIKYADENIKSRNSYNQSFYNWKETNGLMQKDIEDITEMIGD